MGCEESEEVAPVAGNSGERERERGREEIEIGEEKRREEGALNNTTNNPLPHLQMDRTVDF